VEGTDSKAEEPQSHDGAEALESSYVESKGGRYQGLRQCVQKRKSYHEYDHGHMSKWNPNQEYSLRDSFLGLGVSWSFA